MKRIYYLILSFLFCITASNVAAQCNEELLDVCYPSIKEYKFIRSYPVKSKKAKKGEPPTVVRHAVVLSGGVFYRITTCNAEDYDGKLIVSLYSGNSMIASSYNVIQKKHYDSIDFECKQSGVYYLTFYFNEGKDGCSIGILSQKEYKKE